MFRAVTLAGIRAGVDWHRPELLAELASRLSIEVTEDAVLLDGEDVSDALRGSEITEFTRFVADNPGVRCRLIDLQRKIARERDIVTEGRDQGTVAFPDAECKIFLTASAEERARRRLNDLRALGEDASLATVLAAQRHRDERDRARPFGALARAPDATEVGTDGLTIDEVVDRLVPFVRRVQTGSDSTGHPPQTS